VNQGRVSAGRLLGKVLKLSPGTRLNAVGIEALHAPVIYWTIVSIDTLVSVDCSAVRSRILE